MNLNLLHNSVGFYQLSKLVCIPFTIIIQYIFYHQTVTRSIMISIGVISFGVGYATVYDLEINFLGLVYATAAIVATALAQIYTNTAQKSLDCNALQLLYHTSPLITMGLLGLTPVFDDVKALWNHKYTLGCTLRIILSCLFAVGVNITNYLVLGKTSPVTYQVLGHLKTVMILVLGFTFFEKPVDIRNVVGIFIAMTGVVAYTEIKRRHSEPPTPGKPMTTDSMAIAIEASKPLFSNST